MDKGEAPVIHHPSNDSNDSEDSGLKMKERLNLPKGPSYTSSMMEDQIERDREFTKKILEERFGRVMPR